MLAQEATYCVSVPGGTAEVSLNGLRAILGQVEAELYHSEIYGQMLSSLNALPDEMNKQVQCVVRAVGREAIRLAMRKLLRKKPSVIVQSDVVQSGVMQAAERSLVDAVQPYAKALPPLPPPPPPSAEPLVASQPQVDRHPEKAATTAPAPRNDRRMLYPPTSASAAKHVKDTSRRKLSKKELAAQAVLQAREACLQELGQAMRQVRQEKAWSPYHLHLRTQIPMHQLEALETGRIDRLPEDIYLRGFIRQVGNALGMDGNQMANSLPEIDPAIAVLPSWKQTKAQPAILRLNSAHIYLGYAALMASGIAWVSHQSTPHPASSAPTVPPATVAPSQTGSPAHSSTTKTNQKATTAGTQRLATPNNISPPEVSPL